MVTRQATRLYRDDQGVYRWVYYLDMYKNFSILRTLLKALGIGVGLVGAIIWAYMIRSGFRTFSLTSSILFTVIMAAVILAIAVGSYFLVAFIYGGTYVAMFAMDDRKISMYQPADQADKNRMIGLASAAAGAATGNWGLTAAGVNTGGSLVAETEYDDIRSLKIIPALGEIRVHSFLTWYTVYVNPEDMALIAEYLRSRCGKARITER